MTKRVFNKNYPIRVLDIYDKGSSSYDHSDFYTYFQPPLQMSLLVVQPYI